jgi:hypothetical protein
MQDNTVIPFPHPQLTAEDPRTAVLRQGAQRLLAQAIEMEVALLLAPYADRRYTQGREAPQRSRSTLRSGRALTRSSPTTSGADYVFKHAFRPIHHTTPR